MPGSWDPKDLPNLVDGSYAETSCYDTSYNCIAWAANDTKSWWEPVTGPGIFWPPGAARELTIWAYAAAFATLGYTECPNPSLEDGWEKIALFAILENDEFVATHAARQLPDGKWTSKLGDFEDITHDTLEAVCCDAYGVDLLYMKRVRT